MRRRVLVIPAVAELDSFSRLMAHIGHYLSHVRPERVTVLVEPAFARDAEAWLESPSLPAAFDEGVLTRIDAVRQAVTLRPWRPADLANVALGTDLILDWDVGTSASEPWAAFKATYRAERTLFTIDWQRVRLGAASMAEAARVLAHERTFDRGQSEKMRELVDRLRPAQRAYLVGTGPTARCALEHDLSDGVRIVCNTAILDDELMEHVRPQVVTFADPIFHFGPSTYAHRFQGALVEQARRHDFAVVTTERFAPLLRAHAPAIADRVIGLRQGAASWPDSFDVGTHAAVRPYPNVLTMLMLPIAASVARSIGLVGFDGRSPDDDYFWRHGATVQFEEELEDIRLVHPGFFDLNYADYYGEHIATVDRLLTQLEERDIEIRPLADSHIPALRRRRAPTPAWKGPSATPRRPLLVSLTPDWITGFGHFGPFERRVHDSASAAGAAHVALTSAGLTPAAEWQLPTFSEASYPPHAASRYGPVGRRFQSELQAALCRLRPARGSVVFFYTADVWHLIAIAAAAADHPGSRFVVNLMRAHAWIDKALNGSNPWVDSLVDLLGSCLAAVSGTNVTVTVDTEALARDVELLTGHEVGVWPMIAVSQRVRNDVDRNGHRDAVHIVAPVQAQSAKGFPELVALAEQLRGRLDRGEVRLTARWPEAGTAPSLVRMAEQIEGQGVHFIRDSMTDDEFADLMGSADVAFIPYRVRPFRTRTSGLTVDALLAGKPVVAVRGTWSGDLVERLGAGVTYTEGDLTEMVAALSRVMTHRDAYQRRLLQLQSDIEAELAPERLIEFLRGGSGSVNLDPPRADVVQNLGKQGERLRQLFRWHTTSEDAANMAAAIREDDQRRGIDRLRDDIDNLRRSVSHRDRALVSAREASPPAEAQPMPAAEKTAQRRRARPRISRRKAIPKALAGSLHPALVASALFAAAAGWLALAGSEAAAVISASVAATASAMGSFVVAVRLQRRV